MRAERKAPLEAKKRELQGIKMEQMLAKQQEESKRQSEFSRKLPELQLRRFARESIRHHTCPGCKMTMKPGWHCAYRYCQAPQMINNESLMHGIIKLLAQFFITRCSYYFVNSIYCYNQ
jgi:hypothetical protein